MQTEMQRVILIGKTYDDIQKSGLFSLKEINDYKNSYEYHKDNVMKNTKDIVDNINKAKVLWQQKQNKMVELHSNGLLDDIVADQWNQSLNISEQRISKLDMQIEFLRNEN